MDTLHNQYLSTVLSGFNTSGRHFNSNQQDQLNKVRFQSGPGNADSESKPVPPLFYTVIDKNKLFLYSDPIKIIPATRDPPPQKRVGVLIH